MVLELEGNLQLMSELDREALEAKRLEELAEMFLGDDSHSMFS